jgi:hypothetical protein
MHEDKHMCALRGIHARANLMITAKRTRKHSDIFVTFCTGVKITGDYIDDPSTVLCALPLLSLARSVARSYFHVVSIELFLF